MVVSEVLLLTLVTAGLTVCFLLARRRVRRPALAGAAVLFGLAALGPRVTGTAAGRSVLLVDVSASTGLEEVLLQELWRRAGAEGGRAIAFAGVPVEVGAEERLLLPVEGAVRSRTDLAAALERCTSLTRGGDEVVLFTDGKVQAESATAPAAALRAAGVRLRVLPIGRRLERDARVADLVVTPRIREGAAPVADVTLHGSPGLDCEVSLRVDGRLAGTERRRLGRTGIARFRMGPGPLEPGFHVVEATVVAEGVDPRPENDRLMAGVVVGGRRRARLVNADALGDALVAAGFLVASARPGEAFEPLETDLVVLRDTTAHELRYGGAELREFVASGGGLLLLGGPHSFGPGGYAGRPVEDCLAVRSGASGGDILVVVLLDCSGTMQGPFRGGGSASKLSSAKEAVNALARAMPDKGAVLVVPFREELLGNPRVLELGEAEGRRRVAQLLEGIGEGRSGTALVPPLTRALREVRAQPGRRTLVLLLSDGVLEAESPERVLEVAAGLRRAAGEGRLSVLAIGEDADVEFLSRLAGRPDRTTRIEEGGAIEPAFLESLLRAEGEGLIVRGRLPVLFTDAPGAPWSGDLPPVAGFVRTWEKEGAAVWYATEEGHPLVAGWSFGLGRTVAITTDPLGEWAPEWGGTGLVGALADHVARTEDRRGLRVGVRRRGARLEVAAHGADASAVLTGRLLRTGHAPVDVALVADGPGVWRTILSAPDPGAGRLVLEGAGSRYDGGLSIPYPEEYGETGPDPDGLDRLRTLLSSDPPLSAQAVPLGHWVALLGLLLVVADLLHRSGRAGRLPLKEGRSAGR
jgi:hypothetical protein